MEYLWRIDGDEVRFKLEHCELGSVEDFVTKLSIPFHAEDLEVDITTYVQA